MFFPKLLDENSLLNIFFPCLNVMIKENNGKQWKTVWLHSRCALLQMLAEKKEKLLCFLHQNNRIKRAVYYMKKNTTTEIKLRLIKNYSLWEPFTTSLAWSPSSWPPRI